MLRAITPSGHGDKNGMEVSEKRLLSVLDFVDVMLHH